MYLTDHLTLTNHSCIFTMATVVLSKVIMLTLIDEVLSAITHYIVQPNTASSKTKPDEITDCNYILVSLLLVRTKIHQL